MDRRREAIKFCLVEASKVEMSKEESRRLHETLTFMTNLEHIGDITVSSLQPKKVRRQLSFSAKGLAEVRAFHVRVTETMRLAANVFATRNVELARRLFADRAPCSPPSTIHIDFIRDLKRIHGHLTATAYPLLEARGDLAETRLEQQNAHAV